MIYLPLTNISWEVVTNISMKLVFIAWAINFLVSLTLLGITIYKKIKEAINKTKDQKKLQIETIIKKKKKKKKKAEFGRVAPIRYEDTKSGCITGN